MSVVASTGLVVSTFTGLAAVSTATAGASSTPIVVGGDGDLSISAGVVQGFEAGIYRFNKAGGLDGRKIQFLGSRMTASARTPA